MKIILSPAKTMNVDRDSFPVEAMPRFLHQAEQIKAALCALSPGELKALWKCSDALCALNVERLRDMDLQRGLTPAVMSYEGLAYQYMAPGVMEQGQLDYLRRHLRILSGFYGLLRPFDGVTPYRLEMQARLSVDGSRDLYGFWGDRLARALEEEDNVILDLASVEYSRAVEPHLAPGTHLVKCVFGERLGDKVVEKGSVCKMARGEMVRWLAERGAQHPGEAKDFHRLGFVFSPERSEENKLVFLRETAPRPESLGTEQGPACPGGREKPL